MKALLLAAATLLGPCVFGGPAWGQAPAGGTGLAASVAALQNQYTQSFAGHPQLFNGPEYVDYARHYRPVTGHQFFLSPERHPGSVNYNEHEFTNVRLAYDLVLDQVVLSPPNSPLSLRLVNENVRRFTIDGHQFQRLVADSTSAGVIRTGYYEVLVDSSVQVLAKRSKRMQERIVQPTVAVEFTAADRLFIKKSGVYYPIKRKSTAMKLFSDKNKELQKFIQQNKLVFKKARFEASLVQLARYYCSLPPG